MVTCAFDSNLGNYVQPYAYAALYGWMFGLLTLWCVVRNLASRRSYWIYSGPGTCAGLTISCKPELTLLAFAPAGVAWALSSLSRRQCRWREAWLFVTPQSGSPSSTTFRLLSPSHGGY